MELNLTTATGKTSTKKVEVSDVNFACEYNEPLVHQVVTAYLAGARAGTHAQKTRAEVRGGGTKPWNQKGSGRARAGTIRSPLWRSGGQTFAAKPRDYSQKVNKKMYRKALRSIFSELLRQERIVVVDSFDLDAPKTKELVARLSGLGIDNALIIVAEPSEQLYLSARNLNNVSVESVSEVDPVSLIHHDKVLMTIAAVKKIEETLS